MENCLDIFKSYVKYIGDRLKIEGLDLDEGNDCYLAFDGKYYVKCSVDPEKEQLSLLAYIGSLPEDESVYYRGILESCYFWKDTAGANISLDAADGTLLLTQYCDMNMMNNELFYKSMENFVNAMEHWGTKRLEEWSNMKEEGASSSETLSAVDPSMMIFGA